jgi:hypothetical protein
LDTHTGTHHPRTRYPKAHQLLNDEDYLFILRDMLNLSAVLDDMEFTGAGVAVWVGLGWV